MERVGQLASILHHRLQPANRHGAGHRLDTAQEGDDSEGTVLHEHHKRLGHLRDRLGAEGSVVKIAIRGIKLALEFIFQPVGSHHIQPGEALLDHGGDITREPPLVPEIGAGAAQ